MFTGCDLLTAILKYLISVKCVSSVCVKSHTFGARNKRLSVPLKNVLTCGTEKFVIFCKLEVGFKKAAENKKTPFV